MHHISPDASRAVIEADPEVPVIRITRDFQATPGQLMRAHTDPDLFARWVGPSNISTEIDYWDARTGGSWRFLNIRGEGDEREEYAFRGCFHEIGEHRIVQTFTWEGMPDGVSLETMTFEDLGNGRARLRAQSLVDSFEGRDAWLNSGMESGVNDGYAKLDELLIAGTVRDMAPETPETPETPALSALSLAERHRQVAARFGSLITGVSDWQAPTPVPQWRAHEIVEHLLGWLPGFLAGGGVSLAEVPADDLAAAWTEHSRRVQGLLDDASVAESGFAHPRLPPSSVAEAIDRFYTTDVFMHSWDLARASGQDDPPVLEAARSAEILEGMWPMDAMLRESGQFGPRVPVADDAPIQEQLMAFLGRDPNFPDPAEIAAN